MKIEEVKRSLNSMVRYKGTTGIYKFVACTLRKGKSGLYYSAELLDTKHGNSVLTCGLSEIEVEE